MVYKGRTPREHIESRILILTNRHNQIQAQITQIRDHIWANNNKIQQLANESIARNMGQIRQIEQHNERLQNEKQHLLEIIWDISDQLEYLTGEADFELD